MDTSTPAPGGSGDQAWVEVTLTARALDGSSTAVVTGRVKSEDVRVDLVPGVAEEVRPGRLQPNRVLDERPKGLVAVENIHDPQVRVTRRPSPG